jgi:hypothetical protein
MGFYSLKVGQSPSKFFDKVFDAVLHAQRTLSKKTLTKFLMEDFDRVNGPLCLVMIPIAMHLYVYGLVM